jgi:hypothetical protein
MVATEQTLQTLLELVNRYPSPHNGQPIRLKLVSEDSFELYFERERGLQSSDISFIFSFVSMGVFVQHMMLCAQALGHDMTYQLLLPSKEALYGEGSIKFATCQMQWSSRASDPSLEQSLRFRQTSRKKYTQGLPADVTAAVTARAAAEHMSLRPLTMQQAEQAIWLNQRAVFDDMFDEPVRQELDRWLRYTQQQKQATQDGLAYDCMELNGRLMRFIVAHPGILRAPGIAKLLKWYYLRTMKDASDVFYMLAPFATEQQAFTVGVVIMDVWQRTAAAGYYLHPFGTIMSNTAAHRDFLKLAGVSNETRANYLVFIFRAGKSEPPVPSLRLPYNKHLIME